MDDKNTKYISLHEAAKMTDYSQEYISLLCRRGKMKGKKLGRNWFTTKEWISDYVNKIKKNKEVSKNETGKNKEEIVSVKIEDKKEDKREDKIGETNLLVKGMMLATVIFSIIVSGFVFVQYGMKQDLIFGVEKNQIVGVSDSISWSVQKKIILSSNSLDTVKNESVKFATNEIIGVSNFLNLIKNESAKFASNEIISVGNSLNIIKSESTEFVSNKIIGANNSLDVIKNESTKFANNKINDGILQPFNKLKINSVQNDIIILSNSLDVIKGESNKFVANEIVGVSDSIDLVKNESSKFVDSKIIRVGNSLNVIENEINKKPANKIANSFEFQNGLNNFDLISDKIISLSDSLNIIKGESSKFADNKINDGILQPFNKFKINSVQDDIIILSNSLNFIKNESTKYASKKIADVYNYKNYIFDRTRGRVAGVSTEDPDAPSRKFTFFKSVGVVLNGIGDYLSDIFGKSETKIVEKIIEIEKDDKENIYVPPRQVVQDSTLQNSISNLQDRVDELEQEIKDKEVITITETLKGEKGDIGPAGISGPAGLAGEQGLIGLTGAQGSAGTGNIITVPSSPVNTNIWDNGSNVFSGYGSFESLGVAYDLSAGRSLGVGGSTSLGSDSSDTLTVNATSTFNGPVNLGNSSTLTTGTGQVTFGGDVDITGDLTITGSQTYSGAASFTDNSTNPALLVNQQGTGNIIQFQDDGVDAFTIADGGLITATGSTVLGDDATTDILTLNSQITGNLIPSATNTYNLGSATNYWNDAYINNMTVLSTNVGGTTSPSFILNNDNATADTEDSWLEFERGTLVNSKISWIAASDYFDFDFPIHLSGTGEITGPGAAGLTLNNTSGDLTVSTTTSGDLALTSAGDINITSAGAINLSSGGTNALTVDSDSGVLTLGAGTNEITNTDTDTALLINPNGTGAVQFHSTSNHIDSTGNLILDGDITLTSGGTFYTTADGDLVFAPNGSGNLVVGETANTAKIIPFADSTVGYDLGESAKRWYDLYLKGKIDIDSTALDINSLDFVGLGQITTGASTDLTIQPGAGGKTRITDGTDYVDIADGTRALYAVKGSQAVELADGTWAIDATGDIQLSGDITVTGGKLILGAGAEYIDNETSNLLKLTTSGDTRVVLGDALGVNQFQVYDSTGTNKVAYVDSDGNVLGTTGTFSTSVTTPTIYGGTASGDDLTLVSTTDATKGDIYFHTTSYHMNSTGDLVLGGRITFENAEYIANETDDYILFQGSGGADDTDLTFNLDGAQPIIYSATDTSIGIDDDLEFIGAQTISTSAGDLTIDSFANIIIADTTVQYSSGSSTFDIYSNSGATTLTINNSDGTQVAHLDLGDGSLYTGGTERLTNAGALANITGYSQISGDFTIAGSGNILYSTSGTISQTGAGQVSFAGNVDATNGLDVTGITNFAGGTTYYIDAIGNAYFNTLGSAGLATLNSLSVTNGATIGGTLGVTGLTTLATGSTIGNLTLANGSIIDSSGSISFDNENLVTTGTLNAGAATFTSLNLGSGSVSGGAGSFTTLTSSGATDLGTAGASNVNIATTGTGNIVLGNATGTFQLISNGGLNVSTAGALTGVSGIATSGGYTQTGTGANTFTGASSFTFAGTGLSVTNDASVGGTLTVTGVTTLSGGLALGADLDGNGYYAVDLQNIADGQSAGSGYRFDGVNDYTTHADSTSTDIIGDDITIVFNFVMPTVPLTNEKPIFDKNWATSGSYQILITPNMALDIRMNGAQTLSANNIFTINEWSNVVITQDSTSLKYYINGNYVGTNSATTLTGNANSLNIGGVPAGRFLNGTIGNTRIYNRALTATEIKQLYSGAAVDYADIGADNVAQTSGLLVVGKRYRITIYVAGDDFVNVGGTNVSGTEFVATGTTPTVWTNSSSLVKIGAVLNLDKDGMTEDYWYDKSGNNNDGTVNGATLINREIHPKIVGGDSTTQDLILQTTTGVGASGADMHFLVGDNGGTEAITILNDGNVGIGDATPASLFTVGDGDLFQVDSTGAIIAVKGVTNTGALTSSGGIVSLNNDSNFATNIGTGTSTGTITVGNATVSDLALNDAQWSVTGLGAATFASVTSGGAGSYDSLTVGGGYGDTGVSISTDGNIQANGALTIDSISTLTGAVTMTGGFDSNAASTVEGLTIDGNGNLTVSNGTLAVTAPSTTGNAGAIVANSLTSGNILNITSTSTALTSGKLLSLDWSPGSATTATGDLLNINIGANGTIGNLFNITDNGTSLFSVSESAITSNLPHSFTSAGDVSMAYDLLFTNQTASYIKSISPLYLEVGESFESSNLTFKTYNEGAVVIDSAVTTGNALDIFNSTLTSGNGIRFTGPTSTGVTGNVMSLTSDIGSAGKMISLAPDFSGSAVTGYGIYQAATDSTANANTDYGYYSDLTLTGDAAKTGTGIYSTVSSSSTTADTLAALDLAVSATGAISSGTRTIYGSRSQPASTAASSGTQVLNLYGSYLSPSATLATDGTTNVYGQYVTSTASHNADAGIVNQYGLYVADGTSSTNGTATKYGLYVESPTGADSNYGAYFGGNVGIGDASPASLFTVGDGDLFQVNSSGAIVAVVGITNTGALATTGGIVDLNVSSNFATNIGTGTSTGIITIGNATVSDLALNDAQWSVTGLGAATFASVTSGGAGSYDSLTVGGGYGDTGVSISADGNIQANGTLTVDGISTLTGAVTMTGGFDSNAASTVEGLTIDGNGNLTVSNGTLAVTAPSTTGNAGAIVANSLTSGNILNITSTSDALTTGRLLSLDWSPTSATATGDLFRINIGPNGSVGNILNITDDGTSLFSVSESAITSNLPHSFTATGDVSMAYDLLFTNQTASYIKSNAPLYIEAGEIFESNDLTLKTYNEGTVVVDSAVTTGTSMLVTSDSVTTGTGLALSADGLVTGVGADISSTSTAGGLSGTSKLLNLSRSGTNANDAHTAYGLYSAVTNTGTTSTNIGGYFSASGATNNYGLIVEDGNVGIGTDTPISTLNVTGTTGITWGASANSSGLVTVGTGGTAGSSLWVNTPSLNTSFHSGLGVTGSYGTPSLRSVVNINAYGVNSSGGYGSDLAFSTTKNETLTEAMRIDINGLVGIGTTAPDKTLEINAATGGSMRLTYDDSDGGATNYSDFEVDSGGDLTITASGGDITLVGDLTMSDSAMFQPVYGTDDGLVLDMDFSETTGSEELTDGDIETWTTATDLTSWTEFGTDANHTIAQEATTIHNGTYSAKLTQDAASAADFGISQVITAKPSTTYQLNGWVQFDTRTAGTIKLEAVTDGTAVTSTESYTTTGSSFQFLSMRVTTPSDATQITAKFYLSGETGASGIAYIDLLSLKEVSTTTYDGSRYGNDGTIVADTAGIGASYADGKYGQGMQFDGADDYVNCGNDASLNLGTNNFAIEMWMKTPDISVQKFLIYKYIGTGWYIELDTAGRVKFIIRDATHTTNNSVASAVDKDDDTWHFITAIRNGDDIYLYIDGVYEGTNAPGLANVTAATDCYIGATRIPDLHFNGSIDQVKIYNRAISADEVKTHYLRGQETHTDLAIDTSTTAGELYGNRIFINDTGAVASGTDTSYGQYISTSRTGATGGTINTYGQYITATGSGTGNIYGLYSDVTAGTGTTAYALYADAGTGAGTEYAGVFMNGNVGIGTDAPTYDLQIISSVADPSIFNIKSGGYDLIDVGSSIMIQAYPSAAGEVVINSMNGGGSFREMLKADSVASGEPNLILAGSYGLVGIGTDAPTDKLTVRSDSTGAVVSLLRMENLDTAAIGTGGSVDFYANRTTSGTTQYTSFESVVTSIDDSNYSSKLNMKIASNGSLVTMMELGNPNIVMNRPLQVNVAGNTGMSYDLNFMNTGLSQITSEGPLMISAGDSNHYENLTLTTGGTGDIVMDIVDSVLGLKVLGSADGGYAMKLSPTGNMDLSQDLALTGGILTVAELSASDLGTPVGTPATTGGSMAADTYYYVITALNGNGETTKSTETAAITTTGVDVNSVALSWVPVHGATSYKVYRTTSMGVYTTPTYISNPTGTSYTDTVATASAGVPPSFNTTGGRIGINIADATPDARIEVLDADTDKPQMRLAQSDNTDYADFEVDAMGDLTITMSGDDLIIDDNLKVCSGACPTTGYSITGAGNLVVENKVVADSFERICADGYIWVPGSAKFGTMPGFCVMKYEAKGTSGSVVSTSTGLPYVSISQEDARSECIGVGIGYHLISEPEWMTIAENIANLAINDLDSDAGLQLATGHSDNNDAGGAANAVATIDAADPVVSGCTLTSDMENASNAYVASSCEIRGDGSNGVNPGDANDKGFYDTGQDWANGTYVSGAANKAQLRTYVLSNREVIWDFSGNVWEWTDSLSIAQEHPVDATPDSERLEYTAITKYNNFSYVRPPDDGWSSTNGIGTLYSDYASGVATRASVRSGDWSGATDDGVFSLILNYDPTFTITRFGFRCAR